MISSMIDSIFSLDAQHSVISMTNQNETGILIREYLKNGDHHATVWRYNTGQQNIDGFVSLSTNVKCMELGSLELNKLADLRSPTHSWKIDNATAEKLDPLHCQVKVDNDITPTTWLGLCLEQVGIAKPPEGNPEFMVMKTKSLYPVFKGITLTASFVLACIVACTFIGFGAAFIATGAFSPLGLFAMAAGFSIASLAAPAVLAINLGICAASGLLMGALTFAVAATISLIAANIFFDKPTNDVIQFTTVALDKWNEDDFLNIQDTAPLIPLDPTMYPSPLDSQHSVVSENTSCEVPVPKSTRLYSSTSGLV